MAKISTTILTALFIALAGNTAFCQTYFRADLTATQAGSSSTASGEALMCLEASGTELTIDMQFFGLTTDDVVACHIRLGTPGFNGPRIFGLVNPYDDLDDFVDVGTGYESIWDLDDDGASLPGQIPALQQDRLHFLVFTEQFPTGEIRGQILPVIQGDINRDGVVDLLDVVPLIDHILDDLFIAEADFDKNGRVDLLDIAPFVQEILN